MFKMICFDRENYVKKLFQIKIEIKSGKYFEIEIKSI